MALTEDVGSEVRRILTNNTIDQCIQYNQSIKRDIVAAQEELRDVIGQRYRELLEACDRVVGMEDICKSIEASYQSTLEQQQNRGKPANSSRTVNAPVCEDPSVIAIAKLVECEDSLRSCRVLTTQSSFGAAANVLVEFNRLVEDYSDSASDQVHQHVALRRRLVALQVSGSFLVHEIRDKMITRLAEGDIHTAPLNTNTASFAEGARVLADMHAGIEVMEKCSPATALSLLLTLHDEVLLRLRNATTTEDGAVLTAQKAQHIIVCLGWYLAQVEHHRLQEMDGLYSTVAPAASLQDLSQVDPKAPTFGKGDYLKMLRLQLCGHSASARRRFARGQSTSALVAGGWALSPAGTAPAITVPRSEYHRVEANALEVIHFVLETYVASSSALLKVETLLLAPIKASAAPASPSDGLWNTAKWTEAVKHSINTAVEGAVKTALERAQSGLDRALRAQPTAHRVGSFKRHGGTNTTTDATIIASILQSNGFHGAHNTATGDSAARGEQQEDGFASSLNQLNSILDAAGTGRHANAEGKPARSALSATVVLLLLHGIESMCAILESTPQPLASSTPNVADAADCGVFRSGLCSTVAKLLSDLKENIQYNDVAAQSIAKLEVRITGMYRSCQEQWLQATLSRFSTALMASYTRTLLPPALFTFGAPDHNDAAIVSKDSSLSSRFISAQVRSALANVWQTHTVEGTTEVSFPAYLSPGVSRAIFEAHSELLARLDVCGGSLASSLQSMFGAAMCRAHLVCIQSLITDGQKHGGAGKSTICEEAAFQLYFDLSLQARTISLMAPPAASGHTSTETSQVCHDVQQQLHGLQEAFIDVVNFSVAKEPILKAVDAALVQHALSMGLAVSPYYAAETERITSQPHDSSKMSFACTVTLEKETDRLPLLPITTPSQVRNIATSLGLPSSPNGSSSMVGKVAGSTSASSASASISAASLWSATSKLRNLWGQ